jgi:hypothetical protein
VPRFVAMSDALGLLLDDLRGDPTAGAAGFDREPADRIAEGEGYEGACCDAVEVSGIEVAKQLADACADDFRHVAYEVQKHPPHTVSRELC